jgi:hypothetical protein
MARARKFAEAKTDGQTVMEIFVPRAEGDALSVSLRLLTQQLVARGHGESEAGLGGQFGYGVKFENDVFMMHPFCWCERGDCFWCGGRCGCGEPYVISHHLDGKRVSDSEYNAWLATIEKPLPWEATKAKHGTPEYRTHQRAFDRYIKERDSRSGSVWPAVVHTCGHGMFYSRTKEIVALYSPQPYPHSAPHFWHKASGLRVWWYKYIGRDNIVSIADERPLRDILEECLRSIGAESLDQAAKEYEAVEAEAAENSRKAMEFWFSADPLRGTDHLRRLW